MAGTCFKTSILANTRAETRGSLSSEVKPKINYLAAFGLTVLSSLCGCQLFIDDADREVYRLIEQRQMAALGQTSYVGVDQPTTADLTSSGSPYDFVPHPVSPDIPDAFKASKSTPAKPMETDQQESPGQEQSTSEGSSTSDSPNFPDEGHPDGDFIEDDQENSFGTPFTLQEALAYGIRHAWNYRDAREDLYLQALALSLERFLWTPQFVSTLEGTYTEFPKDSEPDRALQAIADVAVSQRLPYGGEIVAQWIGTMVRDLENHVTNSEAGTAILRGNIPLLRGAGRVAFESRYQTERDLIYAVRDFERFRRVFLTQVAGEYFGLQEIKANIANVIAIRESSRDSWLRAQSLADAERINRLEADRTRDQYLRSRNSVIITIALYESSLDRFKILIGMPITQEIDVVEEELKLISTKVAQTTAIDTALASRLDLLNILDRVDDARRSVNIAKNNLLPDLNLSGRVTYTTPEDHPNALDFREDNETWEVGVELEIPLQRLPERNVYRSATINSRRAERAYLLAADRVRLQVRRALRDFRQAEESLVIQGQNIKINEIRREAAWTRFELGQLSNRDVVEADDFLLRARDDYARAQADFRRAILGFRLATGTLRVSDDGQWVD